MQWVNGLGTPIVLVGVRELLKGSKKNKQQGGQLVLPGANTLNFAGENLGNWINGLGVPVVLVGVRELLKGSKKNKQKGGKRTLRKQVGRGWGDVPSSKDFESFNNQSGGGWQDSGDFWSKLPFYL